MKIFIDADEGELARRPADAMRALARVAEADGADREEWLAKAISYAGATKRSVPVSAEPKFRIVEDTTAHALQVYRAGIKAMNEQIARRLEQAAEEADIDQYVRLAKK